MNKQLNLLYFSATDTTEKVVRAIAKGICDNVIEYNITLPENRRREVNFTENDIVIVGVPVYAGRVPDFLAKYFDRIKGSNTYAVFIVVYGNREYDDALLELKNICVKNGFIGIAGAAFVGEHSYTEKLATGRPDTSDLNIAFNFGLLIKEKLLASEKQLLLHNLTVRGKYPYREGMIYEPVMIDTDEICINCGTCSENCPMGAINKSNTKDIDINKCIRCCACIKKCPVNAKDIKYEPHKEFINILINKYCKRQEPELFGIE